MARDCALSSHGVSYQHGVSAATGCADCHGTRKVISVKRLDSPVCELNLPRACAKCHSNQKMIEQYR